MRSDRGRDGLASGLIEAPIDARADVARGPSSRSLRIFDVAMQEIG
jgi:hypothetical protein